MKNASNAKRPLKTYGLLVQTLDSVQSVVQEIVGGGLQYVLATRILGCIEKYIFGAKTESIVN